MEDVLPGRRHQDPEANVDAIEEYKSSLAALGLPPHAPGARDNTQFVDDKIPAGLTADGGVLDQIQRRVERRFESQTQIKIEELKAQRELPSKERIKRAFKNVVNFGIPPPYVPPQPGPDGTKPPEKPPVEPELNKYIAHPRSCASEMQIVEEGPSTETADATKLFTTAVKDTEQMVPSSTRPARR
jgi:hypothetical protein